MIYHYSVTRNEHVSAKSFEQLIRDFEAAVGDGENVVFSRTLAEAHNREEWEAACKALYGSSDFIRALAIDHGRWMGFYGLPDKAVKYVFGNPQVAYTIVKNDIRAAAEVPLEVLIYEAADGTGRIAYDLPSTRMSHLDNHDVDEAVAPLDAKLVDFMTDLAGAPAGGER